MGILRNTIVLLVLIGLFFYVFQVMSTTSPNYNILSRTRRFHSITHSEVDRLYVEVDLISGDSLPDLNLIVSISTYVWPVKVLVILFRVETDFDVFVAPNAE